MFQKITRKDNSAALIRTGTVLVFLFLAVVGVALAGESLSESEKNDLYLQGKEFFHQATEISASNPEAGKDLYTKALLRFNRLVEEGGIRNGKLFYNIGNINFPQGHRQSNTQLSKGRAVYSQRFQPGKEFDLCQKY